MDNIDYSKYNIQQLMEVKGAISDLSPNYNNFLKEYENRKHEIEELKEALRKQEIQRKEEMMEIAKGRIRLIGVYQIISAITIVVFVTTQSIDHPISSVPLAIALFFISLNIFAGITSFKRQTKHYWASLLNFALQTPHFMLGGFSATYTSLVGFHSKLSWGSEISIQFEFGYEAGWKFSQYSQSLAGGWIAIDLLAIALFASVWTLLNVKNKTP